MNDEGGRMKVRWLRRPSYISLAALTLLSGACTQGIRRSGLPAGAEGTLEEAMADIDIGRYDKLYNEAADEWRSESTLEQSQQTFKTLRDKLGGVRVRNLQGAREEQTSTAPIRGHSLVVTYQSSFERGEAMETFTLLEHSGRWYLARYYVTSMALK